MPGQSLTLTADNYQAEGGRAQWHWRLTDSNGNFLADHAAVLDPADWRGRACLDLDAYLGQNAAPDRRHDDEQRLLHQVGDWLGRQVLGPIADALVSHGTPVTVRVVVPAQPEGAESLLYLPLELAHARGRPLAVQDVSLVFEVQGEEANLQRAPADGRLRILAVFSTPTDVGALNLRHERHQLRLLIEGLAQQRGLAIELRVLQYGVTRQALEEVLADGDGWDVVHFSGHGLAEGLVLEKADGTADRVPVLERTAGGEEAGLVPMLRATRGRLKWVTLSACQSAAVTAAETLRWLGLEPRREGAPAAEAGARALPGVARALVRTLGCAVLAMRYPVGDEFAIALTQEVYRGVLEQKQTLPRALQRAVPRAAQGIDRRPLSLATPALFGRLAADLRLQPPAGSSVSFADNSVGLAYFPPPPDLFVGRVGTLVQAKEALAPGSGRTGVLFYGMAGSGKTSCELELAHHYADLGRFQGFVWYQAPEEDKDIRLALLHVAQALERQLPGFAMVQVVERADEFMAWLPRLTALLGRFSVLVVLDNLESLLRTDGAWRDPRWEQFVHALLAHHGNSRTVLTSRIKPRLADDRTIMTGSVASGAERDVRFGAAPLAATPARAVAVRRLLALPIHALNLDEAALLARQLPNLGRLLRGEAAADGPTREHHRDLVVQALRLVQGHPKLLDLADRQAVDPEALARHLERAGAAWTERGERLDAFFREGVSRLDEADFLHKLAGWTQSVAGALPEAARVLFHFLCCLEEDDRLEGIVADNWADLWKRLNRADGAPEPAEVLAPLAAVGLVEVRGTGRTRGAEETGAEVYRIHPGVAEAGRREAGPAFQAAVDAELAAFWQAVFKHGLKTETQGGGPLVVRAGQCAAPYLLRQRRWDEASTMLEQVVTRDQSLATITGVLPLLRRIVEATRGSERELIDAGVLAKALLFSGQPDQAEAMMRDIVRRAAEQGQFRLASVVAGDLINLLRLIGRSEEALATVATKQEYTRRAGLGPWTQLADECQRLQLLKDLGRYEDALKKVELRRDEMRQLPEDSDQEEAVDPWNVRETILDSGRSAALRLQRWEEALTLSAESVESKKARGATKLEVAQNRYNDHGPLIRLERYSEAHALLQDCRKVFEAAEATPELGQLFTALADLEDDLGHQEQAIAHEHTALRYKYVVGAPDACAISHFNLANYLRKSDGPADLALAHRLAGLVTFFQVRSGHFESNVPALARHLASFESSSPPLPGDFAELCRLVEQVEGVRFRELFARLPTNRAATGDEALRLVLEHARSLPVTASKQASSSSEQQVEAIFQAAAAGADTEPLLQALRENMLQTAPGKEGEIDALIAKLRTTLQQPPAEESPGTEEG